MTDFSQRKLIGKYSKKYAYAPYLNEDIGWEMECLPGDDPMEVQEYLKSLSDQTHKKNNPQLYQEQTPITGYNELEKSVVDGMIDREKRMEAEEKISTEQEIEEVLAGIQAANNEKELNQWLFPSAKNIKTSGAYSKRKKQLGF